MAVAFTTDVTEDPGWYGAGDSSQFSRHFDVETVARPVRWRTAGTLRIPSREVRPRRKQAPAMRLGDRPGTADAPLESCLGKRA